MRFHTGEFCKNWNFHFQYVNFWIKCEFLPQRDVHDFQAMYDSAAKEMEDKRKDEPPPKLGPISKQIAAKAKLRPGMTLFKVVPHWNHLAFCFYLDYNPLMGDSGTCAPRRFARQSAGGGGGG